MESFTFMMSQLRSMVVLYKSYSPDKLGGNRNASWKWDDPRQPREPRSSPHLMP